MVGRPKKYNNPQEAASAKLARDRLYSQQQQYQPQSSSSQIPQFILYQPTQQDAPPPTSSATGIRSNLNLPVAEGILPVVEQGIVILQGQQLQVQQVPPPAPILQIKDREVERAVYSNINNLDDINEERETAIIIQTQEQDKEDRNVELQ